MNKRVYESMLCLCILFLIICYILKFFIPDYFMMIITNKKLIAIGSYIDNHSWSYFVCNIIFGFITYYIFICACCRKSNLTLRELILIGIVNVLSILIYKYTTLGVYFAIFTMLAIPIYLGSKISDTIFIFCIHFFSQYLSLNIRGIELYIGQINSLTCAIMCIDMYIWLVLLLIIQLKEKEVGIWEVWHRLYMAKIGNLLKKKFQKQKQ